MRSRSALCLLVLASLPLAAAPAWAGGGNWIELRREGSRIAHLAPGMKLVARASAYIEDPSEVRQRGPYFAWLTPETYAWTRPRVDRPRTHRLGRLNVDWDTMKASVSFVVPRTRPGDYMIVFCNESCRQTFGDVDPTGGIEVFATALEARLTQRLDRLGSSLEYRRYAERRANRRLERGLERRVDEVTSDVHAVAQRVTTLHTAVEGLRKGIRPQIPSWVLVVGTLLAAAAGFGVGRAHTEYVRRRAFERELSEVAASH